MQLIKIRVYTFTDKKGEKILIVLEIQHVRGKIDRIRQEVPFQKFVTIPDSKHMHDIKNVHVLLDPTVQ